MEAQPPSQTEDTDLADAEAKELRNLERRGNAQLRKDVQEARRIYDPRAEKEWSLKYRNFSSDHMRRAYKVYAEARHDPFNKVPNWCDAIVKNIGRKFVEQGITPEEEFAKVDVSHDGLLSRAELRRMLLDVAPDLGDQEVAVISNILDEDNSGFVSLEEFTREVFGRKPVPYVKSGDGSQITARSSQSDASLAAGDPLSLHRTPVHRVHRIPPAVVEGWEHLRQNPKHKEEGHLLKERDKAMFKRIGAELCLSPRPMPKVLGANPKYNHFGGGADTNRFRSLQWRKDLQGSDNLSQITASTVPDPGGFDVKPGYHVHLAEKCPHYVSPRRRPRES